MNRITNYYDGNPGDDVTHAYGTMAFCYALMRLARPCDFTDAELSSLESLQSKAARIFGKHGLPVPRVVMKG
jgi:hypothetical protein